MTTDEQYEQARQIIVTVFEERKAINKKFLSACEKKLETLKSEPTENPTKWVIGKLAFQEFDDVFDNLETMGITLFYAVQNIDQRIRRLEKTAIELDTKVNSDDIASVAKFAEEFRKQVAESKKKLEEYKLKMKENDLAT